MLSLTFKFIITSLYFFLPAYFTNMTPPLAKKADLFNFLDKPIDSGKTFQGLPIFGSHKTWRGLILGIIVGILIAGFQFWLYQFSFFRGISLLNYSEINIFVFGLLISSGAVFGDLLSAFIKRRLNLKPGAKFIPLDQVNYVIGAFIFLAPFFTVSYKTWLVILFLTFFLHIIVNRLGFWLGLHQAKW